MNLKRVADEMAAQRGHDVMVRSSVVPSIVLFKTHAFVISTSQNMISADRCVRAAYLMGSCC